MSAQDLMLAAVVWLMIAGLLFSIGGSLGARHERRVQKRREIEWDRHVDQAVEVSR